MSPADRPRRHGRPQARRGRPGAGERRAGPRAPPPRGAGVAVGGAPAPARLVATLAVGAVLFRGRKESLNVKGAFLHVMADALGSVGVLVAALVIRITGSYVWD